MERLDIWIVCQGEARSSLAWACVDMPCVACVDVCGHVWTRPDQCDAALTAAFTLGTERQVLLGGGGLICVSLPHCHWTMTQCEAAAKEGKLTICTDSLDMLGWVVMHGEGTFPLLFPRRLVKCLAKV